METAVESPDMFRRNEQSRASRCGVAGLVLAPADHHLRAEFPCLAVGTRFQLRRRQQNGDHKKQQSENRHDPAIPQAQWKHHKRGAEASQREPENGPRMLVTVELQELRETPQSQKQGRSQESADSGKKLRLGGDDCGCRAHGWTGRYFTSGARPCISLILAKARRRWGIVIEPPTTAATFRASITSSRFQPTSPQRTKW